MKCTLMYDNSEAILFIMHENNGTYGCYRDFDKLNNYFLIRSFRIWDTDIYKDFTNLGTFDIDPEQDNPIDIHKTFPELFI